MMKRLILTLLVALVAAHASGQVITTLKSYQLNVTPASPAHLVRGDDGTLYGMSGYTLYRCQSDGSGFTVLKQVADPLLETFVGPLSLSGSTLYGMVYFPFSLKVFKINTDGSGYTLFAEDILAGNLTRKLQIFYTAYERPGVMLSGNTLYGWGFKINTDGTGYTELAGFPAWNGSPDWYLEFEVSGTNYFGSTSGGGLYDAGTVFKLNAEGTGYTILANVSVEDGIGVGGWRLKAVGDSLYGYWSSDRMFKVNTDGNGYSVLSNANLPGWNTRLEHSDGAFYWASASYTNNQASWAVRRMNTDGTGYAMVRNSTNVMGIRTVAGGGIYGVTSLEGTGGALFKMNTDGSGYAVLHEFAEPNLYANGSRPGRLTVWGGKLYGYDSKGAFMMNTDGTGFNNIPSFPAAALPVYGTIGSDGPGSFSGKIIKLNTNGSEYTILRTFQPTAIDTTTAAWTNSDGVLSGTELMTVSGNTLYGAAGLGGLFGGGTVFKMNTDGTDFVVLKHFPPSNLLSPNLAPMLTFSGDTLYGASFGYSESGGGTVWRVNTDGTGFTVVKQFPDAVWDSVLSGYTNSAGVNPTLGLAVWGNTIYGTTSRGGRFAAGTLFKLNTNGTNFEVLQHIEDKHRFTSIDGNGLKGLVLSENAIFGAAPSGGDQGIGGIYRIDLVPTLSISRTDPNSLAVTWPSVWTGYLLQQNANGLSSLNWSNVADTIQDDGTNKTLIINPTYGSRFYRLVSP